MLEVMKIKVNDYEVPEDLYYSETHEWLKIEDGKVRVGITDYARKQLGNITYVGFEVSESNEVKFNQAFGEIESEKATEDLYSPVSGKIIEVNSELEDMPQIVEDDPYGKGWMIVVEPTGLENDLKNLMNAKEYAEYLRKKLEEE